MNLTVFGKSDNPIEVYENNNLPEYVLEAVKVVSLTGISLGICRVQDQWVLVQLPVEMKCVN